MEIAFDGGSAMWTLRVTLNFLIRSETGPDLRCAISLHDTELAIVEHFVEQGPRH